LTVCANNLLDPNAIIKGRIDNGVIGYQDGTSVLTPSETGVSFTTVANYRGVLTDLIKVKKGSKYYINYTTADDSLLSKSLYTYDDGGNYIQNVTFSNLYTIPNTVGFIRVGFLLKFAGSVELTDMYIKEESSGDLFETYNGTTYNIDFVDGSTPLTVHDGELDVITGVLTVNDTTPPTTYQLTPTEVKTLLGSNNIFADTGDVLNAEYTRDASIIINELLERVIALEQGA
jgi:hypothetical protein